jgi:hypothetical protein
MYIGKTTDVCAPFVTEGGYIDYSSEISGAIARFEKYAQEVAKGNWTILYRDPDDGRFWRLWVPYDERLGSRLSWVTKREIPEWFPNFDLSGFEERVDGAVVNLSWEDVKVTEVDAPRRTDSEFFAVEFSDDGVIRLRPEIASKIRGLTNAMSFVAAHPSEPGRKLFQSADYRCWDLRFPFMNATAHGAPRLTWISGDGARIRYGADRVSIFKKFL